MNVGAPIERAVPLPYVALLIGLVMWVPTISTVIVIKFITKEGFGLTNLRVGSFKPYVTSALAIPACFVLIYALTHPLPLWLVIAALLFLSGTHILLDHRDFIARWMRLVGMSPDRPWLSIVVDQIFHLLTLAIVAQVLVLANG